MVLPREGGELGVSIHAPYIGSDADEVDEIRAL